MDPQDIRLLMKVKTPDGIGKIINATIGHNASQIHALDVCFVVVWYGIDVAGAGKSNGWITREYNIRSIEEVVEEIEDKDV